MFLPSNLFLLISLVSSLLLARASPAGRSLPPGITKTFVSRVTGANLTYIENSGICETTKGVHQISGYVTVGPDMHMWFWFFASRHKPDQAPFTLWLNGGPGCSSMLGLFTENGPCTVNPDGATTKINPYSWNEVSNMIYIDQPIGTGFSYGDARAVDSTSSAAPYVWKAFQILFESQLFSKYQSRQFNLATESYGGHYGPEFAAYFEQQNALIKNGSLHGAVQISLYALLINNGIMDAFTQLKAFFDFAANAPGYGPLVSSDTLQKMNTSWYQPGGCLELMEACYAVRGSTSSDADQKCLAATDFCRGFIEGPVETGRSAYDLTRKDIDPPFPPEDYSNYLARPFVLSAIGANATYSECSDEPLFRFLSTGDYSRSLLPELATLADSGIRILIWAGDKDITCNWVGGRAAMLAMEWSGKAALASTPLTNMTVNGKTVAEVQNVENVSWARVYNAGHFVPTYQPVGALEIFKQFINGQPLHSV